MANASHTQTFVNELPNCDLNPRHGAAYADARLPDVGSWGFVCKACFTAHRCQLGLGKGQRLVVGEG